MVRTQIHLAEDEIEALDRVRLATGASRSELIRRAIRELYAEPAAPEEIEERLADVRAARGIWRDREFTGEEYARTIRRRDVVDLPDELKLAVERVASESERSEAEVIRAAVTDYTARAAPRPRAGTFSHGTLANRVDELLHKGFGGD